MTAASFAHQTGLEDIFKKPGKEKIDEKRAAYSDHHACKNVAGVVNADIDPRKGDGQGIKNHDAGKELFNQLAAVKTNPGNRCKLW